jgi:transcriptional regulator with XRE-family HTH domain
LDTNYIRKQIKYLMNDRGTTCQQLADFLKVSTDIVYRWFSKRSTNSFIYRLRDIAEYFNVPIAYLTGSDLDDAIDDDISQFINVLQARPELRKLLRIAQKAKKTDVDVATYVLCALNQRKE